MITLSRQEYLEWRPQTGSSFDMSYGPGEPLLPGLFLHELTNHAHSGARELQGPGHKEVEAVHGEQQETGRSSRQRVEVEHQIISKMAQTLPKASIVP